MENHIEYWMVSATGGSATKLDPKPELLNSDGTLKKEVIEFYEGRIIEIKQKNASWGNVTKDWIEYCIEHAKDETSLKFSAWLKENYNAPTKK